MPNGDDALPANGNGNGGSVRWDRLNDELHRRDERLRADFRRDLDIVREDIRANTARARSVATRVDKLESVRDEQRGAWRLALWLIGGNLIATVVLLVGPVISRAT